MEPEQNKKGTRPNHILKDDYKKEPDFILPHSHSLKKRKKKRKKRCLKSGLKDQRPFGLQQKIDYCQLFEFNYTES